jgi:predicted regulator of amino acid metabolism with ACT domain
MKITRHGTWVRDQKIMVRLNEIMQAEIAAAAAEDRRTVAETILNIVADWIVDREIARLTQGLTK